MITRIAAGIIGLLSVVCASATDDINLMPVLMQSHEDQTCIKSASLGFKFNKKPKSINSTNTTFADCVISEAGTLANILGDKIYNIDSIAVTGPINNDDFNTLWDSSFNGHLKIINLENATIENGIIPDEALFHKDEQVNWKTMVITTIWLEKLLLPDGVTEIGNFAVAYAIALHEIKFPNTLQSIGKAAFTDCISLTPEQLLFPESLKVIGEQAFYECRGLTGKITLPESLHAIICGAFYHCRISEINIPNSLEYLGCMAFAGSTFKNICLPDNCLLCSLGGQFYNNWELTEAHLPDKLWFVPDDIFSGCISLQHVNIPSGTITIGEFAFDSTSITEINFPETLESIGQNAFQGCDKLNTVVLPSSVKNLGERAFALCSLKSIYSMATVPPEYVPASEYESSRTPFTYIDNSIPVYIPIGTKQQYMSAPGWEYMTNFIETEDFPYGGIDNIYFECGEKDNTVYDLCGRKIATPISGHIYISKGKKFILK